MQIGQILVEQGWVAPAALARALADQAELGRRICSLLILRGELDPDNAARALSQQHGVPGVLQKHLEHRDLTLPPLLPAALGRSHIALPIGRTSLGALIVCVRDPRPEIQAAIAAAVSGRVVVAVAPAYQLEHLVRETYYTEAEPADDLVLQLAEPSPPARFLHDPTQPPDSSGTDGDDVDVDLTTRQIPVINDPLADLGSMTLVELDDARVAKDPTQSGGNDPLLPRTSTGIAMALPRTTTGLPPRSGSGPHPAARTTTVSGPPRITGSSVPPRGLAPAIDAAIAAIEGTTSSHDASDAAMYYLAGRFQHAVWFTIEDGAALGERGHGDQLTTELIQAISIPLRAPSIVQLAHDTRALVTDAPAGPIQDRLWRTLGAPQSLAAVPIEVDAEVAAVIAVGDAIGDPATAGDDLIRVAEALSAAFRRMMR